MSGQLTVIEALLELSWMSDARSLTAATTAVLSRPAQSPLSVTPETWIVIDAALARLANEQSSTLLVIAQPATAGPIAHATPPGRTSWRVTFLAVPAPWLLTTIVKAATSPALIVPLSAVLTTLTSGQLTTMSALSVFEN